MASRVVRNRPISKSKLRGTKLFVPLPAPQPPELPDDDDLKLVAKARRELPAPLPDDDDLPPILPPPGRKKARAIVR
jgi:hypothetical protein